MRQVDLLGLMTPSGSLDAGPLLRIAAPALARYGPFDSGSTAIRFPGTLVAVLGAFLAAVALLRHQVLNMTHHFVEVVGLGHKVASRRQPTQLEFVAP